MAARCTAAAPSRTRIFVSKILVPGLQPRSNNNGITSEKMFGINGFNNRSNAGTRPVGSRNRPRMLSITKSQYASRQCWVTPKNFVKKCQVVCEKETFLQDAVYVFY